MRKLSLAAFLLLPLLAFGQTAVYPGAIATDNQLLVAVDNITTTLNASMAATDLTFQVVNPAGFVANTLVTIGGGGAEQVHTCNVSGNTISVGYSTCPNIDGRGYAGTTAAAHGANTTVGLYQNAWFHNDQRVEIEAMQAALGVNLGNLTYAAISGISGSGGRQGSSTKPQMAGTNSGTTGANLCNDASGNSTTSACTQPAYSQITGPTQGNSTKPQMAGTNSGVTGAVLCDDASGNDTDFRLRWHLATQRLGTAPVPPHSAEHRQSHHRTRWRRYLR